MPELDADPRVRVRVDEVDDALPGVDLPLLPQARAAGRDPPVGRDAEHLGHHEPGAAERARAEVHEMEVVRVAVHGRVHVHRRDDDAILELELAETERHEHRRPRRRGSGLPPALRLVGEPAVDLVHEAVVAQAQVVVRDPAAAREQVEDELDLVLVDVLRQVLEPLRACKAARWVLATSGLRAASYAASAAGTPSSRRSAVTSSVASSTASFVAEPIEKCAVCAASPSSAMLSWNQRSTFSVGKLSHLELFVSS